MTNNTFLKDRRVELQLTQKEVAAFVGVSEATLSRWEPGNIKNMRRDKIAKLAKILQISPSFIVGEAPAPPSNVIPVPSMYTVPLVGTIACGKPVLAAENLEGDVSVPEHIHADFALRCKGDSMINARIFDGDIVYIRSQAVVDSGEIAAVVIRDVDGEDATLKRVRLFQDHLVLEPANPMYQPLSFWGEDMNSVRIIGKAVGFTSVIA